jgi:RNA polymerase sigma-32 factor
MELSIYQSSNYNLDIIDNLKKYKNYVNSLPLLEEKDERFLLENFKENGCLKSAQKLVLSQLKTVLRIAYQYKNYGLPEEDLIQEGNIGLMKAVKNFDINQKVRLYTYALVWIKAEIQSFIMKNWKIVKISTTNSLKKLFFNFKSIQKEMLDLGIPKSELTKLVSQKLDVPINDIKEIESYMSNDDISIDYEDENHPVFQIQSNNNPEKEYVLNVEKEKQNKLLKNALKELNEKQLKVIEMRYYVEEKKTHKEIASILNISSERVRQIENEALEKIKKIVLY